MIPYYADMSALTLPEASIQYCENAMWIGDIAKARLFLEAAIVIQYYKAQGNTKAGTGLTFEALQKNIDDCALFVKTQTRGIYGSWTRVRTVR